MVNQDTFLFHGTVEENIRLGRPDAAHDDLVEAARAANIHDFIESLPQGYATVIGEKGIKLSGGQRQRVAIARALLRDTPILVLDEALQRVDAENEAVIQEALDRLMQGRTTLILAHRLSSVIDCDRILVLDGGRVAEQGRHAALMAKGGVYATLMAEQAQDRGEAAPAARPSAAQSRRPARSRRGREAPPPVTEGIIKAEGLTWYQVVGNADEGDPAVEGQAHRDLHLRRAAGGRLHRRRRAVGADRAGAEASGRRWTGYAIALAIVAPLSGVLHWLESWLAHDMAFRLLAEMRIDAYRKLEALAPAYLVRRRTGDLMALATHDIELIEYFFAHTVAPAFVAMLVPAVVIAVLASASFWLALALLPFLLAVGLSPLVRAQARRSPGQPGARGGRRARRLRRRFGAGPGRDRRLPAGGFARRQARPAVRAPHLACACRSSPSSPASMRSSR